MNKTFVNMLVASAAVTALAAPRPASADWPQFGRAIVSAPASQQHSAIASDGADGAIVVWQDGRNPRVNIFAQHVRSTGDLDPAWPETGRALLTDAIAAAAGAGGQTTPSVVSDGNGGA